MTLRAVFMGTPAFAVPTLMELLGQGHEVVAAYSQPPRPSGRGMAERPSPVHEAAERFGIPVRTPISLRRDEAAAEFRALEADVAVVVAYGLILPPAILAAPRHGCLNLHGSLLPRWRGAAPIQRAIMAGDAETGVMVMRMEEGLDTGPVCMAERVRIGASETAGELSERLARLGADLMVRALAALERDALSCTPQPAGGVTYAGKIDKSEARIDWTRPAVEIARHVNGLSPFPGAWCEMVVAGKPERVKVLRAVPSEAGDAADERLVVACGDGAVELLELQRAGRKPSKAEEFLRGARGGIRVLP